MINSKRFAFTSLLAISFMSTAAFASNGSGGEVSGGTDYRPNVPAWFTSQDIQTVDVCYEISPTFIADPQHGVDASRIEQFIVEAFGQWDEYYHVKKGLKSTSWGQGDDPKKAPREIVFRPALPLKKQCVGTEDLSFYFGTENDDVRAAKRKLNNPFALAALKGAQSNAHYGWTPGFVWIANTGTVDPQFNVPMWTNYEGLPLQRIILHELGHVFGCSHIDGTIMEDLSQWMLEKTQISHSKRSRSYFLPLELRRLMSIDAYYDLITDIRQPEQYVVRYDSFPDYLYQVPSVAKLFERLTGKLPVGNVSAVVNRNSAVSANGGSSNGHREGEGVLRLTDSIDTYDFPFSILTLIGEVRTPGKAFFMRNTSYSRSSKSYFGMLKKADGSSLPVGVNYNMDYARFSLVDLSTPQEPGLIDVYPNRFLLQAD